MQRKFRLAHSEDFERVRRSGKSFHHRLLILVASPNEQEHARVGVVAGRSVGNAVERNRAKRLMREALRSALDRIRAGWDIVLIARPALAASGLVEIRTAAESLLMRAGLMDAD